MIQNELSALGFSEARGPDVEKTTRLRKLITGPITITILLRPASEPLWEIQESDRAPLEGGGDNDIIARVASYARLKLFELADYSTSFDSFNEILDAPENLYVTIGVAPSETESAVTLATPL